MIPKEVDKDWWEKNKFSFKLNNDEIKEIVNIINCSISSWDRAELNDIFIDLINTIPSLKKYDSIKYLEFSKTGVSYYLRLNPYVLGLIDEDKPIYFINDGEYFFTDNDNINVLSPSFINREIVLATSIYYNSKENYKILKKYPLSLHYDTNTKFRNLLMEGDSSILKKLGEIFLKITHDEIIKENRCQEFKKFIQQEKRVINIISKFPEYEEIILCSPLFNQKVLDKFNNYINNLSTPKLKKNTTKDISTKTSDTITLQKLKTSFEF